MADTEQAPVTPAASIVSPVVATVTETPAVAAPAAVTEVTSSPAPVVESADKIVPSVKTEVSADSSTIESVINADSKPEVKPDVKVETKAETKPDATKPAGDTAVEAASAGSEVKVELPSYEAFKLPEGIDLDKAPLGDFTKLLGEIETGKLDHKGFQEAGQKLVDLAIKGTTDSINRLNDSYVAIHEGAKKARLDALKADPEMGGEKFADTVSTLQTAIAEYGGSPEQIKEFRKEVMDAGLDASPALCRLLSNMQQKINKYTTEADNGNGGSNRIVPGQRPAPSKVKDYNRFYGGGQ